MTTYTAVVTPVEDMFEIVIEGVGVTQAETLDEVEEMARDYIALDLDVPADSFEVRVMGPAELVGPVAVTSKDAVLIPGDVPIEDLEEWKRHIWFTPGLTVAERQLLILAVLWSRGECDLDELVAARQKVRHGA